MSDNPPCPCLASFIIHKKDNGWDAFNNWSSVHPIIGFQCHVSHQQLFFADAGIIGCYLFISVVPFLQSSILPRTFCIAVTRQATPSHMRGNKYTASVSHRKNLLHWRGIYCQSVPFLRPYALFIHMKKHWRHYMPRWTLELEDWHSIEWSNALPNMVPNCKLLFTPGLVATQQQLERQAHQGHNSIAQLKISIDFSIEFR